MLGSDAIERNRGTCREIEELTLAGMLHLHSGQDRVADIKDHLSSTEEVRGKHCMLDFRSKYPAAIFNDSDLE